MLNTHFKAISSLKEVVIHDYGDLSNDLVKMMRDYGWTLKLANHRESEESEDYTYRDI